MVSGHRQGGFTLIELLVVVSVIAVLAGLLLPAVRLVKDVAASARCAANMRQVGLILANFEADNDGSMVGNGYGSNGTASWNTILNTELLADEMIRMPRWGDTERSSLLCPLFETAPGLYRRSFIYNFYAGGGDYDIPTQTSDYGRVFTPPSRKHPAYAGWKFYALGASRARFNDITAKVLVYESDCGGDYCQNSGALVYRHRDGRVANVVFMDGRVEAVRRGATDGLKYGF